LWANIQTSLKTDTQLYARVIDLNLIQNWRHLNAYSKTILSIPLRTLNATPSGGELRSSERERSGSLNATSSDEECRRVVAHTSKSRKRQRNSTPWTQGEAERRWVRKSANIGEHDKGKVHKESRVSRPLVIVHTRWMKALSAGALNAFSSVWWAAFRSRRNEVRVGGQEA
jgi:hypothetical protein